MEKKTYNIIGDIHGRTNWKDLVSDNAVQVFVGDYFDPYADISEEELITNFYSIVDYAEKHPGTILLYGNHDFHYLYPDHGGTTSRYNHHAASKFKEIFEETRDMFHGLAYVPVDSEGFHSNYLVTHAGVTSDWFFKYCDSDDFPKISPDVPVPVPFFTEQFINNLWKNSKDGREFSFTDNCDWFDTYGTTPTQSPIWIRPQTLDSHNLYDGTDIIQVVGHTQMYSVQDLSKDRGLVFVDCLGQATESYKIKL